MAIPLFGEVMGRCLAWSFTLSIIGLRHEFLQGPRAVLRDCLRDLHLWRIALAIGSTNSSSQVMYGPQLVICPKGSQPPQEPEHWT